MHKVGLGETGGTVLTRGERTQCVVNFLQGSGAGYYTVWVIDMGPFDDNGEEGGRDTHWVPFSYHGSASKADKRRDMGDA